jgi:adenine phosphoribosyltransferase
MAKTVKDYIRTIVDFPHEGILFRDVTTLFADPRGFRMCVDQLLAPYAGMRIDKVAGLEARGFILGGAVAHQLSTGFVPIRKKGKLPGQTISQAYKLEYGEAVVEVHDDAMQPGEKVLLVDDLLATGGTAEAGIRLIERLGVVQIDSVNVVSRTHYLPAFSRLGDYPRETLEEMAWAKKRPLFEYWAHEASLLPLSTQPLLRWRMEDALEGRGAWKSIARFLRERRDFLDRALDQIAERGPMSASELEMGAKGAGGWWGWSESKHALECLFWSGELTTATRRGTFERVYGLPHKVLPRDIAEAPTPSRDEAQRGLLMIAARAMGVATERDLRDYFRMDVAETRARLTELVEAGALTGLHSPGIVVYGSLPAWTSTRQW